MQVNDLISLGQLIRNRRKELFYPQKYISEITGFSMSFLSDLENGKDSASYESSRVEYKCESEGVNGGR